MVILSCISILAKLVLPKSLLLVSQVLHLLRHQSLWEVLASQGRYVAFLAKNSLRELLMPPGVAAKHELDSPP
jgi:hypothetical protein